MTRAFIKMFFIICIGTCAQISLAQDERSNIPTKVYYQKSSKLKISSKGINRINFWPKRIVKIIGDLSMFTSNVPEDGSNLFLTSKLSAGKVINVSVVLSSGEPLDLSLEVVDSANPKFIDLIFAKNTEEQKVLKQEIDQMLSAMQRGVKGKYYIRQPKKPILTREDKKFRMKQISNYQYKKLLGGIFEIQNKTRKSVPIVPKEIIGRFNQIEAYTFDREILLPREKIKAYIIFKSDNEAEL